MSTSRERPGRCDYVQDRIREQGALVWRLLASDGDGPLVAFYGELFGRGLQGFSGGGYTMIDTRRLPPGRELSAAQSRLTTGFIAVVSAGYCVILRRFRRGLAHLRLGRDVLFVR